MLRLLAPTLLVLVLSLGTAVARADVVSPPPDDCPAGTLGQTCHGEPYCDPQECAEDGSCPAGQRCVRTSMCTRESFCGGGWGGPSVEVVDARGSCSADASCPPDRTCSELAVCMPGEPAEDAGRTGADASADADGGDGRELTRYGCGCRVGGATGSRLAIVAGVVALAASARRRRRR